MYHMYSIHETPISISLTCVYKYVLGHYVKCTSYWGCGLKGLKALALGAAQGDGSEIT